MTDFNVADLLGESAENPWIGMRQSYTDMLAAGFTEEQAMSFLTTIIAAMVTASS